MAALSSTTASRALIVGISGATCSGKTSVAKLLAKTFVGSQTFNQDDFYFDEEHKGHIQIPELNHINWEVASAFDNERLAEAVADAASKVGRRRKNSKTHQGKEGDQEFVGTSKDDRESSCNKIWQQVQQTIDPAAAASEKSAVAPSSSSSSTPLVIVEGITIFNSPALRRLCDVKVFLELDKETCWDRRKFRSYDPPDPPGYFDKIVWPFYEKNLAEIKTLVDEKDRIHFIKAAPMTLNEIYQKVSSLIFQKV